MSATIIPFPRKTTAAHTGELLRQAFPVPPRDDELDILVQWAGKLVDNAADYQAVDCFILRLDAYDAR